MLFTRDLDVWVFNIFQYIPIYSNIYSTLALLNHSPSSETQGQSAGPGEWAWRKFSSTGGRAPGYRLSQDHFQTVKRMLAPDWAQKMLCIIAPNRRTVSPELFSWVRTLPLLSRHSCPVRSPSFPNQTKELPMSRKTFRMLSAGAI